MKIDWDKNWGSHLPVLAKALSVTTGDVCELGMGPFSTPYLHWLCFNKRKLVSYESNREFYDLNIQYNEGTHEVHFIDSWDQAVLEKPWDVVLIDHAPSRRRIVDIKRLAPFAKYIVVHDTQRNYKFCDYKQIYPLFKYRYDYKEAIPWTTVLSNFAELTIFMT